MDSTDEGGGSSGIVTRSRMDADNSDNRNSDYPDEGPSVMRTLAYGVVPGEEIGNTYLTRIDLKCVHFPTRQWIHRGPEGPYSLIVKHGVNMMLDEGKYITIFTQETIESLEEKKGTFVGNLWKALKSHIPIRIVRIISDSEQPILYRYDGLYTMKIRAVNNGLVYLILRRNNGQRYIHFDLKGNSMLVSPVIELKKKSSKKRKLSRKPLCIKKEIEVKKEISTSSDPERDSSIRTFCWQQFKEETVTFSEEETYNYDDNDDNDDCNESLQEHHSQVIKADPFNDSDVEIEESTFVDYHHQSIEKVEMYYRNEETIDLDEEAIPKENVIIESIPAMKYEDGENSNDVTTILAIVPECGTSDYVKDSSEVDIDPLNLIDPLENYNQETKNSNYIDEDQNAYQEIKNALDEKKSEELYHSHYENEKNHEKQHNLSTYPTQYLDRFLPLISHRCLYNLTLAQIINAVKGNAEAVCPCCMPKSSGQQHLEGVLATLFEERENLKCIKKGESDSFKTVENTEAKGYYQLNHVFEQLATVLGGKTNNELQAPLFVKRKRITTNRIVKKEKSSTRKFHVKKFLSVEESIMPSEDPSCTPLYISPTALRDDVDIPTQLLQFSEDSQPMDIGNIPSNEPLEKQRRKRKCFETNCLGPMISPNNDSSPRSKKGRILTYTQGSMVSISPYHRRNARSIGWREREGEGPNGFLGFEGPFRPPSKLRLITSYINKLSKS